MVDVAPTTRVRAAELLGAPLWPVSRGILEGIDEGPETTHIFRIGRRGAKTYLSAIIHLHALLFSPRFDKCVQKGERRCAVVLGRKQEQAEIPVAMALGIVEHSPFAGMIENASDSRIDFTNNTSLIAATTADSARGLAICSLSFTEAAYWIGEGASGEDSGARSAYGAARALRPALLQFPGAIFVIESTAGPREGYFYDECVRAESGADLSARAWHFTSLEANPTLSVDDVEAERARDPAAARCEIDAEWDDGPSAFLDPLRYDTAPARDVDVPPLALGQPVVVGFDAAFAGGYDLAGVCVLGRDRDDSRHVVVAHCEGLRPRKARSFMRRAASQAELLDRVCDLARRYGAQEIVIDGHHSTLVATHIKRKGLRCHVIHMSPATRTMAYGEVRDYLYQGLLDLPNDPDLLGDLRRLRTRITGGSTSVAVPRVKGKGHGDRGSALALATLRQVELGAPRPPEGHASGGPAGVTLAPGSEMQGALQLEPKALQRDLVGAGVGKLKRPKPWKPGMSREQRAEHEREVEEAVRRGLAQERQRRRRDPDRRPGGVRLTDTF